MSRMTISNTVQAMDSGKAELRAARRESRMLYWAVGLFSFFVNVLMLAGPLYMLNVYDRVLGSRSFETLLALSVLVAFLFAMMAILDIVRGRVMGRVGARLQSRLDNRVFAASLRGATIAGLQAEAASGPRDLESVQRLVVSPALMAVFDLPFAPLFFAGIFIFHPMMGYLALAGAFVLFFLAVANQTMSRRPLAEANAATQSAEMMGAQIRQEAELVLSLGMREAAFTRWRGARDAALGASMSASDVSGSFTSVTRAIRLLLQSAMLGLGALLVLRNELSPGAMIAGSILLGRALAPIEMIVGQAALFQRAREGWRNLSRLLGNVPVQERRTSLPPPKAKLEVDHATVLLAGEQVPTLRAISFSVGPGQAVGVIGPSGAGKSTLAKALTGFISPMAGRIRLDGAPLDQYEPEMLGRYIGYLPQRVALFDGTIKDNIARLSAEPDDDAVVLAAKRAGAHDMILKLPSGYDTHLRGNGDRLSGGQIQRIGLARAMYGEPVMLVLDEPNSNLDNDGSMALNDAVRDYKAAGRCVLIMAHRPAAIQHCDLLLVLDSGTRRSFGPKDEVLRELVKNHEEIQNSKGSGGVS